MLHARRVPPGDGDRSGRAGAVRRADVISILFYIIGGQYLFAKLLHLFPISG
jgi:hypothetical protein